MSEQSTVLTDADARIWVDSLRIQADTVTAVGDKDAGCVSSIEKWTIHGGPGDGVDVVELDNGCLKVSVLPTRGMGLWKAHCDGLDLGWLSPVRRPVHPALVRPGDSGGLGWLAGFHELLTRCGLASHGPPAVDPADDRPVTLHGRIANLPAHQVTAGIDEDSRIWVRGLVDETALFGPCLRLDSTVSTTPGSNQLSLCETVTNLAGTPTDFELLYHTNIGQPLLEQGARLVAPARRVVPADTHAAAAIDEWNLFGPPTPGFREQCYFLELAADADGQTQVVLHDKQAARGVALGFHIDPLPCFTLWKNTVHAADGYVAGIEPSTDLPNTRAFERSHGRLISLDPEQSWSARIDLTLLTNPTQVAQQLDRVAVLTPKDGTHLCREPRADFSPED
jgi:hypothetical protein